MARYLQKWMSCLVCKSKWDTHSLFSPAMVDTWMQTEIIGFSSNHQVWQHRYNCSYHFLCGGSASSKESSGKDGTVGHHDWVQLAIVKNPEALPPCNPIGGRKVVTASCFQTWINTWYEVLEQWYCGWFHKLPKHFNNRKLRFTSSFFTSYYESVIYKHWIKWPK